MLFDIFFLGFPLAAAVSLICLAMREQHPRFWHCAFSFIAYCAFYLAGGRECILYVFCGMTIAGGILMVPL